MTREDSPRHWHHTHLGVLDLTVRAMLESMHPARRDRVAARTRGALYSAPYARLPVAGNEHGGVAPSALQKSDFSP